MAPIDLVDDLPDAEEDYHESSDEDFNPVAGPAEDSSTSSDEEDAAKKPSKRKGKRRAAADDELDSGDEVTIGAARKRKSKKRKRDEEDDLLLSDLDGEGGLIKTRAQRKEEQKERKPLAKTDGATVDVDALWAQMLSAPLNAARPADTQPLETSESNGTAAATASIGAVENEEHVTIKKDYTFAGQHTTEETQVPRSALGGYLSKGWKVSDASIEAAESDSKETDAKDDRPKIRRPLRRPTRFDPNPIGFVRALPPEYQLSWPRKAVTAASTALENAPVTEAHKLARREKAQKLNVVDKSRLDWTGFVHKEGIADELDTHGKTKEAYLGRMQFLAGVEARREDERKRMKTVVMS